MECANASIGRRKVVRLGLRPQAGSGRHWPGLSLLRLAGLLLVLSPAGLQAESGAGEAVIDLGATRWRIEETGGWFLGLGGGQVNALALQASDSLVFPLIADEWATPAVVGSGLKLIDRQPVDGGWDLRLAIYGGSEAVDWQAFFLWDEANQVVARDEFRFARTRPLAEVNRKGEREAYLRDRGAGLRRIGELIWQLRPHTDVIAGWPWVGWKWRVQVSLDDGNRSTAVRLIGGMEIGGRIDGLTLVNHRYRGLGNLEQSIRTDGQGGAATTYNTQDTFARPSPLPEGFSSGNSAGFSREQALALRANSWIHTPARGAGTSFFDYQYRAEAALLSYPPRQGNLRALTEIYPGDSGVGQSSEEHFGYRSRLVGEWMQFAVLEVDIPRAPHFWRNRYLEIDRELRMRVGAELGFASERVVPTVGYLFDIWSSHDRFAPLVARMADYAGYLAGLGVRNVMTHNPGWENGRAARHGWDGADPADFVGGSVNTVYDWAPLPHVRKPWRNLSRVYDQLGLQHFIWISGMSQKGAPFALAVGEDPANWALNSPGGPPNETYGVDRLKHNILSPRFAAVWNQRLDDLRRDFGFAGYWGDSFQNLMMSQLDWAGGGGEPQQRAWWEWLAQQSREGRGWIAESHSFPGLSCSIETENWDQTPWMLGQVVRWLRGTEQTTRSPEEWARLLFRVMAYDGWLAPEIWPYYADREVDPAATIRGFARLAHSFNAARPLLQRPWLLADGRGVLWTAPEFPGKAVLFPFERIRLPDGLLCHSILDHSGQLSPIAPADEVVVLLGADIAAALGIDPPPLVDRRLPFVGRAPTPNLPGPARVWRWQQTPGAQAAPVWASGADGWLDDSGAAARWPDPSQGVDLADPPIALFAPDTRAVIEVAGRVNAGGWISSTPGVSFVIDTVKEGRPGSLLEISGPTAGPVDIYFRGTLRGKGSVYTEAREQAGLRLRGGHDLSLQANLLPWPGDYHRHSQIVSLADAGTTVHFRGRWPATGELNRPGLTLDAGTRFVVWPEAELPFIKNYGGFTLQWWVGRGANGGGTLELHPGFVADRSRERVSVLQPQASQLGLQALGSIRLQGVTLITHDSRNLPITGRLQDPDTDSIQNNGHLVFEYPHGGRWEVRSRAQSYRGAVWIDGDTTIFTERDLTLRGITETADTRFNYVAANAFQTRRARGNDEPAITIRKEGPASLLLLGEQAYVAGSRIEVAAGTLVMGSDPAAGGRFPDGKPAEEPVLVLQIEPDGVVAIATELVRLAALDLQIGGRLDWRQAGRVSVVGNARLDGILDVVVSALPSGKHTLLEAAAIEGTPTMADLAQGSLRIERDHSGDRLILEIQ